ncbi:hypothetical protein KVR01_009554 [Diaporthe batatas]|uniref:uncharacterized protein n=1 Tax=Diaporthe batatas TaxID=748121 RepID=UPI001D03966F|nr:uncharacterized protein KVR01_009554 [Diaporthe batatas]KAG8161290.1 hypothetical protein KVR01_009554 [Diaporthe batatas]
MQYFQAISIISALAGLTFAAPAAEPRQFKAVITFSGAAASYTLDVPTDATVFHTNNGLAVDTISSLGGATCSFSGVDGATVTIVGARSAAVAPPQAIVSGSCLAF